MELVKRILQKKASRFVVPVLAGGILGYFYYAFIGCNGSCAIAGNPWISTIYGAVVGSLFIKKLPKELSNG
jgi:hypothetical protein